MISRSRRLRRYYLAEDVLVEVMWGILSRLRAEIVVYEHKGVDLPETTAQLPKLAPLPKDSRLEGVCYSWERRQFGFMFSSATFDEVLDGDMIPDHAEPLRTDWQLVEVRFPWPGDEAASLRAEVKPEESSCQDLANAVEVILDESADVSHGLFDALTPAQTAAFQEAMRRIQASGPPQPTTVKEFEGTVARWWDNELAKVLSNPKPSPAQVDGVTASSILACPNCGVGLIHSRLHGYHCPVCI